MSKSYYTWENIHNLSLDVALQVKTPPDVILAIAKGGSIPGAILAEHFGAKSLTVGIRSYNKQDRGAIAEYQSINLELLRDSRILVIDDIADSGATFEYITKKLKNNFCDLVETASLFYKPCSKFKPTYIGTTIDSDVWVVFPWEQHK